MGINVELFLDDKIDDFVCAICLNVLSNPTRIGVCGHYFCGTCVREWFTLNNCCPLCRKVFHASDFVNLTGPMQRIYKRLKLRCEYEGCNTVTTISGLKSHFKRCAFKPNPVGKCVYCKREIYTPLHCCWKQIVSRIVEFEEFDYNHYDISGNSVEYSEALLNRYHILEIGLAKRTAFQKYLICCAISVAIRYRKIKRYLHRRL